MLERSKKFCTKGNIYEVSFPTVGQFIDIECLKVEYTQGQYGNLISSRTIGGFRAVDIVDTISHLQILCPSLVSDRKVKSFQDLDALDFLELVKDFNEQLKPWLDSWFKEFNLAFKSEEEKSQKKSEEESKKD